MSFKTLKQENIKYISLMNNQFHVGNIILNAKFKGHKVFFNELFHQNDSKFVKKFLIMMIILFMRYSKSRLNS